VKTPLFNAIHAVVAAIPAGRVTTYGAVARRVGGCTPRHVGWALAGVSSNSDLPWHRVINARGAISLSGEPAVRQRELLAAEGVEFSSNGDVDLDQFGWSAGDE
jgi:methylated-DNA-protein-cysteine methyltransferase-like protein